MPEPFTDAVLPVAQVLDDPAELLRPVSVEGTGAQPVAARSSSFVKGSNVRSRSVKNRCADLCVESSATLQPSLVRPPNE